MSERPGRLRRSQAPMMRSEKSSRGFKLPWLGRSTVRPKKPDKLADELLNFVNPHFRLSWGSPTTRK